MEDDLFHNGGCKRSPPSLKGGPMLACFILVMELASASREFVTALESLSEPNGEPKAHPSLSIEV